MYKPGVKTKTKRRSLFKKKCNKTVSVEITDRKKSLKQMRI